MPPTTSEIASLAGKVVERATLATDESRTFTHEYNSGNLPATAAVRRDTLSSSLKHMSQEVEHNSWLSMTAHDDPAAAQPLLDNARVCLELCAEQLEAAAATLEPMVTTKGKAILRQITLTLASIRADLDNPVHSRPTDAADTGS